MKSYLAIAVSSVLFATTWFWPHSSKTQDVQYHHRVIDMITSEDILRSDRLTRVKNNRITQLSSLQDESLANPIMLSFKGVSQPHSNSSFLVTGKVNLLSVQELEPALNDKMLSPYLVFNDEPKQFNIKILYSNHAFMILKNSNNGRTMLYAKR
ncbi:hypothetical protein [Vibrio salilacus]|uniref:hypothetical protein n=1 Tax=Vibrio salilacus TaxID=1323749 RepID=UPI000C2A417E|nr:hypothetical protein [Vibrio salilacus]